MRGGSCYRGRFMKNFRFDINCNITQEPQELQKLSCACGFIGKSPAIKYHRYCCQLNGLLLVNLMLIRELNILFAKLLIRIMHIILFSYIVHVHYA